MLRCHIQGEMCAVCGSELTDPIKRYLAVPAVIISGMAVILNVVLYTHTTHTHTSFHVS